MVTGKNPLRGQHLPTVLYKIVNDLPVPPRQINPSITAGISAVIMRALEKDPGQRYESCREMLEDLRNYRSIKAASGDPQSTMALGGGSPTATMISGNAANRVLTGEEQSIITTPRSLNAP